METETFNTVIICLLVLVGVITASGCWRVLEARQAVKDLEQSEASSEPADTNPGEVDLTDPLALLRYTRRVSDKARKSLHHEDVSVFVMVTAPDGKTYATFSAEDRTKTPTLLHNLKAYVDAVGSVVYPLKKAAINPELN